MARDMFATMCVTYVSFPVTHLDRVCNFLTLCMAWVDTECFSITFCATHRMWRVRALHQCHVKCVISALRVNACHDVGNRSLSICAHVTSSLCLDRIYCSWNHVTRRVTFAQQSAQPMPQCLLHVDITRARMTCRAWPLCKRIATMRSCLCAWQACTAQALILGCALHSMVWVLAQCMALNWDLRLTSISVKVRVTS